jgi:hypothetical protein
MYARARCLRLIIIIIIIALLLYLILPPTFAPLYNSYLLFALWLLQCLPISLCVCVCVLVCGLCVRAPLLVPLLAF